MMFIDPPGPFAPLEEWRDFLTRMRRFPPSPERDDAIAEAEAEIARLEQERRQTA